MKCMRCGNEIAAGGVFCEACLAEMAAHPVDPNTPVLLPRREKQLPAKRSKRRQRKPEEQLGSLRRLITFLVALVILLAIALTGAVYLLLNQPDAGEGGFLPGQNYGTASEAAE